MNNSSTETLPCRLFDFQVNGFGGVDFQDPALSAAGLAHAVATLRRHKTAGILVTLITDEMDRLCRRLERFEALCDADPAARSMITGYHIEGPWVNPEPGYRGAHPKDPMHAPVAAEYDLLQEAARGKIRLITLAPEWPGSPEFISHVVAGGTRVALGHTNANDEQIDVAIKAGARFCTHLGNGTPPMMPRHDNIIQRLLARDELTACLIPDGVHLPPGMLKNLYRAKPTGRVLFTTDSMSGAGAPPGIYTLAGISIEIGADGVARQPGGLGLAGSTLTPDRGVHLVTKFLGLPLEESLRLWSDAAAEAFGVKLPPSA